MNTTPYQENTCFQGISAATVAVKTALIERLLPSRTIPLVVFDLETTIFPEKEAIQIAGVVVNKRWEIEDSFCFFTNVDPVRNLGYSGLTVIDPEPPRTQLIKFLKICENKQVASWSAFDYAVLHNECDRYALPFEIISKNYLDLCSVVKELSLFMGKQIDRSLSRIAKNYGLHITEDELHDARYDAKLAFETYKACLNRLNTLTTK